jgi:hypothetical protein
MTNTKANNEQHTGGIPRRGFFGALAATVAGAVGLGQFVKPSASPIATAPNTKPVVSVHPNAVPRTDESSRRHG